jgi:hypothetical protein
MTVGGVSIDVGVNPVAAIDTGTSLMLVSEAVADAINSVIPGAEKDVRFWTYSCSFGI